MSGSQFRSPVDADHAQKTVELLQPLLTDLSDLALQLKHAHWNVRGALFLPIHQQLDKIVETVREASDEVAERIVTLGHPANGLAQSIATDSRLNPLRMQFLPSQEVIEAISARLDSVIQFLRVAIAATGELDPISQDLLIGIAGSLEKHLWMVQSQHL
jgi:starvation-inducible DNA-binding protein